MSYRNLPLPLVLGSQSPARKALLERLKLPFTCYHPNIDESLKKNETVTQAVERLAIEKAKATAAEHPNSLIISCDQLISLDHTIFGKPLTHANAVKQLSLCSNQVLTSYTGLCVLNTKTLLQQCDTVTYQVKFKTLNTEIIEEYLNLDKPYHCAGSIKAEALGITLFDWMKGDDPSALTGLPLITLTKMLEKNS